MVGLGFRVPSAVVTIIEVIWTRARFPPSTVGALKGVRVTYGPTLNPMMYVKLWFEGFGQGSLLFSYLKLACNAGMGANGAIRFLA